MAPFNTMTDQYNRLHGLSEESLPEVADALFTRLKKQTVYYVCSNVSIDV